MIRSDTYNDNFILLECDDCHNVMDTCVTNLTKATMMAEQEGWKVSPDLKEHICNLCVRGY